MNPLIKIKAVGDVAGGDQFVDGLGVAGITVDKGCGYIFEKLEGLLQGADLVLGNLEGPLSRNRHTQPMRLCGVPDLARELRNVGFSVMSVANNHILDFGPDVFLETVKYCAEAGIDLCGLRGDSDYYSQPVIKVIKGKTIGILAYNWICTQEDTMEGQYIATVHDSLVNYTWDRDQEENRAEQIKLSTKNKHVLNDIRLLKKEVDIVLLLPHWGYEWVNSPPYGLIQEAHTFIDSGADLIIGTHPHVIQGVEKYKNGIIAYSLGNFLFDEFSSKFGSGMALEITIAARNELDFELEFIDWSKHFQPMPATDEKRCSLEKVFEESSLLICMTDNKGILDDNVLYREYEWQYNRKKVAKVLYFLRKLPFNPSLIGPISRKIITLLELIYLRLKGQKVRW